MSTAAAIASTSLVNPEDHAPGEQGWRQLVQLHRDHDEVSFLYSRSLGGLEQSGRGRIARLDGNFLTIESGPCTLLVVLAKATYEFGPQLFFSPDLQSRFNVEGVAVSLANYDWLFITAEAPPSTLGYQATRPALPAGKDET